MTARKSTKASVIAPPESLAETDLAPRNKAAYVAPPAPEKPAPAAENIGVEPWDAKPLRDAITDAAQSINPERGDTDPGQPVTPAEPAAAQAPVQNIFNDPSALLQALLAAGVKFPEAASPTPAPVAPPVVQTRRLVTNRVVSYLHALSEIDADQFGKKLDDLTEMLVARSRARTEDARRLQDMTAAMHIYQEFEELWLKGSQIAQPR